MISALVAENLAACSRIYVEAFTAAPYNESWEIEDAAQRLDDVFFTPRTYGVGASTPDGELVGFALGRLDRNGPQDYFLLQEFAVLPAHQRQGYGIALIKALRTRLPQAGHWYLLADRESPAVDFYAKLGFQPAQRTGVFLCPAVAIGG